MVLPSLAIGGAVGVLLSGGFIYWEVGRFAAPQVPTTVFDERKLLAAYTVGLFVGVPLAVAYVLLTVSLANGALVGALVFLLALVGGAELAQHLALRTHYWKSEAAPFYALALRAGIGGIVSLTVVSTYLGLGAFSAAGIARVGFGAVAVVLLETTGALVTLASGRRTRTTGPRPFAGILFGAFGFFLVTVGPLAGEVGGVAGAAVALLGSWVVYRRVRTLLEEVRAPREAEGTAEPAAPTAYGRTRPPGPDRGPP